MPLFFLFYIFHISKFVSEKSKIAKISALKQKVKILLMFKLGGGKFTKISIRYISGSREDVV